MEKIFMNMKYIFGGISAAIVLMGSIIAVGINDNGYRTVIQTPSGDTSVKFGAGWYGTYFGSTWEWTDYITFDYDPSKGAEKGTIASNGINVRYQDGGTGSAFGIVRFVLPNVEDEMITLHKAFRSKEGLASKLLRPVVESAHTMAAGLMTSEASYAEKRGLYMSMIEDQLRNGLYVTKLENRVVKDVNGNDIKKNVPVIVYESGTMTPKYQPNDLAKFNITVAMSKVTDWTYERKTLEQISDKRKATMAIITAKANAERAKQDAITEREQGIANVMKAKYAKEQDAIKEVVDAEKAKQVAEIVARQQVEVARQVRLEQEQLKLAAYETKKKEIALGQGEAERKRLVMMADGALEKKLATYERVAKYNADAVARIKVPSTVVGGGGADGSMGGGAYANSMLTLMGMKAATDLGLDMTMKTGK